MKLMKEFRNELAENDKKAATIQVDSALDDIKETFKNEKVDVYIDEVKKYILDNLSIFVPTSNPLNQMAELKKDGSDEERLHLFSVNVILDNSQTLKAPVVIETTPSYTNLFGTIERTFDSRGYWRTDFTKIKAGSLLKADNGYLIVNALDLFTEPRCLADTEKGAFI